MAKRSGSIKIPKPVLIGGGILLVVIVTALLYATSTSSYIQSRANGSSPQVGTSNNPVSALEALVGRSREFTATIMAISPDGRVQAAYKGTNLVFSFQPTNQQIFNQGGKPISLAQLRVGDEVQVRGKALTLPISVAVNKVTRLNKSAKPTNSPLPPSSSPAIPPFPRTDTNLGCTLANGTDVLRNAVPNTTIELAVTLTRKDNGQPIPNATIVWGKRDNLGGLATPTSVTNQRGKAINLFYIRPETNVVNASFTSGSGGQGEVSVTSCEFFINTY